MIPIDRMPCPIELTASTAAALTARFKANPEVSVWNQSYIRTTLLRMSNNKCVYCETIVDEESKYMEVDHYACKKNHVDLVVDWNNLLPSCKRCNGQKSTHDVHQEGAIIDPTVMNPKEHICLKNYRFVDLTEIGETTINVLDLNNKIRLTKIRFMLGEQINETFVDIYE